MWFYILNFSVYKCKNKCASAIRIVSMNTCVAAITHKSKSQNLRA